MLRRICFILLTGVTLTALPASVDACGDKFLRIGRSARFHRYASVHPSAILVYAQRWTAAGIKDFETMLKRAGHRPVTVTNEAAFSAALTVAKYDLVITSYAYAAPTREALRATASTAALLPIIYKPNRDEEIEARAAYEHVLRPDKMSTFDALEEIDHLIGLRLKASAGVPVTR